MQGFVTAGCEDVKQQLQHSKFSDGRVFPIASKLPKPGTVFVAWRAELQTDFRWLHTLCAVMTVITRIDKLSNNYALSCLKYHVSQVLSDPDSGQNYMRVLSTGNINLIDKLAGSTLHCRPEAVQQSAPNPFQDNTDAQRWIA